MVHNIEPACTYCRGSGMVWQSDGQHRCPLCHGAGSLNVSSDPNEDMVEQRSLHVPTCAELLAKTLPRRNIYSTVGQMRRSRKAYR